MDTVRHDIWRVPFVAGQVTNFHEIMTRLLLLNSRRPVQFVYVTMSRAKSWEGTKCFPWMAWGVSGHFTAFLCSRGLTLDITWPSKGLRNQTCFLEKTQKYVQRCHSPEYHCKAAVWTSFPPTLCCALPREDSAMKSCRSCRSCRWRVP